MNTPKTGFKMSKSQAAKLGNLIKYQRENPYLAILGQLRSRKLEITETLESASKELEGLDVMLASLISMTLKEEPVAVLPAPHPIQRKMHRKGLRVCEFPLCHRKGKPYRFFKVDSHYCSKQCADLAYHARGRVALHRPSHKKGTRQPKFITPESQVPLAQREAYPLVDGKCQYPQCQNVFQYRLGRGRPRIYCVEHKDKSRSIRHQKSLAERAQLARRQAKRGVTLYRDQDHIGTQGNPTQS
jgi:hypothetical protein